MYEHVFIESKIDDLVDGFELLTTKVLGAPFDGNSSQAALVGIGRKGGADLIRGERHDN